MKKFKTIALTVALIIAANFIFAQSPVKQYCGGTNGSVSSPANALGNDLSNFSTLKLRTPNAKKDNVYQSFVFTPETTRGTRVAFVIQTDVNFDPKTKSNLNLTFYLSSSEGIQADTLTTENLQITSLNPALNLYEVSFVSEGNFDTAGVLLQGGGILKTAKIYKVYLAISQSKATPCSIVTAKK